MILFFDTETNGLIKDWKTYLPNVDNFPRVVQLAYAFGESADNMQYRSIIIKPEDFDIPELTSNIHGITKEFALANGFPIKDILKGEFYSLAKEASLIVGHNIIFDIKVLKAEYYRLGIKNPIKDTCTYCTMIQGMKMFKTRGFVKLMDLYKILFNEEFENAHDALSDIKATERCFWRMINNY